ncbi:MAG: phosphoribosylformylglycinamidine cyclo-ligase [Acidobacteriaceae bacterium]|nr:phosphoribosylformylglycinamidine cyclo-ligase [Acidobacteriaceae bacterium]
MERERKTSGKAVHRAAPLETAYASPAHQRVAEAKNRIRGLARRTFSKPVLSELGGFAGLFALDTAKFPEPVLVASADGVGSKLQLAAELGLHASVAADLVNHCANDLAVQGATPLFFLDHIAAARLDAEVVGQIASGFVDACRANGMALLGGETAEMPLLFRPEGHYELAGFAVGVVSRPQMVTGATIEEGDVLLALPSTGLHTEGYALAQRLLLEEAGYQHGQYVTALGDKVGAALMRPHRSYLTPIRKLLPYARGFAHITGGGLSANLPRILPKGLGAEVDLSSWEVPALFAHLAELGTLGRAEMFATFNMGVGLVAVLRPDGVKAARLVLSRLNERCFVLGRVVRSTQRTVLYR